jgi:hypothetical protein
MASKDADAMLMTLIGLFHKRLADATSIAAAAKACAAVGNLNEAIRISLSIDQPLYDATKLSDAAALLKRMADDGEID